MAQEQLRAPESRPSPGSAHSAIGAGESVLDEVEEADRESFPASDPPSWWAGRPSGPPA